MTLKEIADLAGIVIFRCDPNWGGTYGYRSAEDPHCSVCGYKTEDRLIKAYISQHFGDEPLGKLCLKLLLKAPAPRKKKKI